MKIKAEVIRDKVILFRFANPREISEEDREMHPEAYEKDGKYYIDEEFGSRGVQFTEQGVDFGGELGIYAGYDALSSTTWDEFLALSEAERNKWLEDVGRKTYDRYKKLIELEKEKEVTISHEFEM